MNRKLKIPAESLPYADYGKELSYPQGLKWTKQRKCVYRVLWETVEPLSAIQIYQRISSICRGNKDSGVNTVSRDSVDSRSSRDGRGSGDNRDSVGNGGSRDSGDDRDSLDSRDNSGDRDSGEYAVSTVYRILAAFEEKGLVEKSTWMEDGTAVYSLNRGGHTHYAVCLKCRSRIPLQNCPFSHIHLEEGMEDFTVTGHKLELYGYCRDCREKERQQVD